MSILEHDLPHIELGPPKEVPELFAMRALWPPTIYDAENGLHFGPPSLGANGIANVPSEPHIFRVDKLKVSHQKGEQHDVDDVNVLLAHGYNRGGQWVLDDGRSVSDLVYKYNEDKDPTQRVHFLLVCNPGESGEEKEQFDNLKQQHVGFAVGSKVGVTVQPVLSNDESKIEIHAAVTLQDEAGQFYGL